jgi:glucose/mannose transport system substrate-binding protein
MVMKIKRKLIRILTFALMLCLIISSFALADIAAILEDTNAGGKLDVYHWWTAGGEKEAIDSALAAFSAKYPNIKVVSNAIPGGAGGSMVMKVKVLALSGASPETFQAHPGLELEPYLESSMLSDLSDLWEYADIEARLLQGVAELCQVDGQYYIVPIGIHKTNTVFYNIRLFNEYGVAVPEGELDWDDFWALCDELQEKLPEGKYPLDLGDRKAWPAT